MKVKKIKNNSRLLRLSHFVEQSLVRRCANFPLKFLFPFLRHGLAQSFAQSAKTQKTTTPRMSELCRALQPTSKKLDPDQYWLRLCLGCDKWEPTSCFIYKYNPIQMQATKTCKGCNYTDSAPGLNYFPRTVGCYCKFCEKWIPDSLFERGRSQCTACYLKTHNPVSPTPSAPLAAPPPLRNPLRKEPKSRVRIVRVLSGKLPAKRLVFDELD